jgi:hypothetical protein
MTFSPRVFISHSAKEPEARARLHDIVETLKAKGFLPIVDYERLKNGDLWWETLQQEIKNAHAVIVLVSHSALASDPVYRELVLVLSEQVDALGLNRVFVLRLPDVRSNDIEQSRLSKLRLQSLHTETVPGADAVAMIVPRLLQPFLDAYGNRPTEKLEAGLRGWLDKIGLLSLGPAAHTLGLEPEVCRGTTLIIRLAQQLLEFSGDPIRGADLVQRFLEHLRPAGDKDAHLVDVLLSAATLPDSVRAEVAEVLSRPEREAVSLAVAKAQTGLLYLRRACMQWRPWFTYTAGSVASQQHLESLRADVRAQLKAELRYLDDDDPSDDDLKEELEKYEQAYGPMTVIVTAPPDSQLVRELARDFPRLLFVFVAGADRPDQPVNGVRWVQPALPPDVEHKVLRAQRQLQARHGVAG